MFVSLGEKVRRFEKSEAAQCQVWVAEVEYIHQQLSGNASQLMPTIQHSLIFRRWMCDYWAAIVTLPDPEFEAQFPGRGRYEEAHEANNANAAVMVELLTKCKNAQQVIDTLEAADTDGRITKTLLPMILARYQLRPAQYVDFAVYEYGCWNLKNRAFQQVARRRHEGIESGPWTHDEIAEFSRWVDAALISQISHMKQGPGWDEVVIRLGLK